MSDDDDDSVSTVNGMPRLAASRRAALESHRRVRENAKSFENFECTVQLRRRVRGKIP